VSGAQVPPGWSYPKLEKDPTMICPHCNQTIREEQRYLMSVDPDAETPRWAKSFARYLILFLVLVALFALLSHASVL
jgi:hypothetical protein